ncbi:MAG: electron transport complex subunit RsxC [Eubacterium sp.]|nr:electron transport complex subunit RsxC [Eubacterium sp.]MDE6767719.1 electron transport complex subunit RsxC [Eubacterium sp.]
MLKTFKKGVHPYEGKELSKDCPIQCIEAESVMVYPLSQHIGAPAKAVVAKGDRVLKGQLIAEAGGFISAPVFSSVSGTVKAIEQRLVVNGNMVDCIVIENDMLGETVDGFGEERDIEDLSANDIVDIVKNAGIVGLGGAGFPTGVKISPKNVDEVDTLIINAAECEPYLTSDYRLLIEKSDDIIKGIKAVLKVLPNAKAVIGIENNKSDAIKLLEEKTACEDKIGVCPLKTKYPQGGERQLIFAVTGRKINSKMLPADKGCVVINTGTCYAIFEAVYKNMPLIHNILTITGEAVNQPCNFDVPLGVSHSYVLEKAGGAKDDVVKFISGGPMMGMAMSTLDVPVVKTSSSILAFSKDDAAALAQSACIHCGRCVKACPENLVPQMLAKSVRAGDVEKFDSLGGFECMECGSCTYVCPAKIPLTQMFRLGKAKVREMRAKN